MTPQTPADSGGAGARNGTAATRAIPSVIVERSQKVAAGGVLTLAGLLVGAALQYGSVVLIARLFGQREMGHFAFALSIIAVVAVLGQFGAGQLAVRFVSVYRSTEAGAKLRGLFRAVVGVALLGCVVAAVLLAGLSERIALAAGKPDLADALAAIALLVIPFGLSAVVAGAFQGLHRFGAAVAYREVARPFSFVASAVLVTVAGREFLAFLRITPVLLGMVTGIGLWQLYRAIRVFWVGASASFSFREWATFSGAMTATEFVAVAYGTVDVLILGFVLSAAEVAVYYGAARTLLIITALLAALNAVLAPMAAELWEKKDVKGLDAVYKLATRWTVMGALPIGIAIVLLRGELMGFLGPEYASGTGILLILTIGRLANGFTGGVGRLLIMTGHQRAELINTVASSVLLGFGTVFGARSYGLAGAAVANAAVLTLINIVKLIQVYVLIGIQPYDRRYVKPMTGGLAALGTGWVIHGAVAGTSVLVSFLAVTAGVAITYLLALGLFGLEAEDRAILTSGRRVGGYS